MHSHYYNYIGDELIDNQLFSVGKCSKCPKIEKELITSHEDTPFDRTTNTLSPLQIRPRQRIKIPQTLPTKEMEEPDQT